MSVFPKRVTFGENVILHVKIKNRSNKIISPCVFLSIERPDKIKESILRSEKWVIPPKDKKMGVKEKYYFKKITKKCPLGKYFVNLKVKFLNKTIISKTKKSDCFFVEHIKIKKNYGKIKIINESCEPTRIRIFGIKETTKKLKPHEEVEIKSLNIKGVLFANNQIIKV